MREILFRGKKVDSGEWIEGLFTRCKVGNLILPCIQRERENDNGDYIEAIIVNGNTLGQYTGLTDKNGNKIFEGDIIVLSNDSVKGEIFFNEKISAFQLRYLGELGELFEPKFLGEWITCYSIVGNIHDKEEVNE